MEPTLAQLSRLHRDVMEVEPSPLSALITAMEKEDERFISLIRLRREYSRTRWWQVRTLRRITRDIKAIRDAQQEASGSLKGLRP